MSHENGTNPEMDEALQAGRSVLSAALSALAGLEENWDPGLVSDWTSAVLSRKGRVVLCGMGKSGLIAQKISATMASTGTPTFFLHPAEALHGDLGMVTPDDSILALSNSGESEEVVRLLPSLQRLEVPVAAITCRPSSSLAKAARWVFQYDLPGREGCPLDLAPMASTTLQLVWGDMLAASLMARRKFTKDHFALNHPAGSLGAKLLKVSELAHTQFPMVASNAPLMNVLHVMTLGRLGMTTVVDEGRLSGVISDGDLRRSLERLEASGGNPFQLTARELMSSSPRMIAPDALAVEAVADMESRKITFLLVMEGNRPVGVFHLHDYLGLGVRQLKETLGSKSL